MFVCICKELEYEIYICMNAYLYLHLHDQGTSSHYYNQRRTTSYYIIATTTTTTHRFLYGKKQFQVLFLRFK